jgi:hypothetical protein
MSANAHDCLQWLPRLPDQTRKGQIQGNTEESGRETNGVERRERPPTKRPAFGSKTPTVVIMAGKIPASDFVAFVDAVEQRRAMEEYGNADWMIHAVN